MRVRIRSAKQEDASVLSDIALAAKRHWGYPDEWLAKWTNVLRITPDFIAQNPVWVASDGPEILGFLGLSVSGADAEIEHLWVLPPHINHGVGRKLLEHALRYCRQQGVRQLRIESDPHAKGFYERFGARQIGETESEPASRLLPVLVIDVLEGGSP